MRGDLLRRGRRAGGGRPAGRGTATTPGSTRERLAGEDDDEDHPWAVLTDAPELALELLVDEYDGWLDAGSPDSAVTPAPPLDLPTGPRRIKRPG